MADMRDLFGKATASILEAYADATDIRLEEFDKSQNSIVVSFLLPDTNPIKGLGMALNTRQYERVYKDIQFDGSNNVSSLKIYKK